MEITSKLTGLLTAFVLSVGMIPMGAKASDPVDEWVFSLTDAQQIHTKWNEMDTVYDEVFISDVTNNGDAVSAVSQLSAGDTLSLRISFKNTTAQETEFEIFAAYYNASGKLLYSDIVEDPEAYTVQYDPEDVSELAFFVWSSISDIIPLSAGYRIGQTP